MKVKIGKKIYDSNVEPIMLILGDDDKFNIEHMDETCASYCSYPEKMSEEEAEKFMVIE